MSRPDFREHLARDRRLIMVRQLLDAPGYALNEAILEDVLESYGHQVSRDTVRGDMAWLAEQDLVTLETVGAHCQVATITKRGEDVAQGHAQHPGVRRPSPRG